MINIIEQKINARQVNRSLKVNLDIKKYLDEDSDNFIFYYTNDKCKSLILFFKNNFQKEIKITKLKKDNVYKITY